MRKTVGDASRTVAAAPAGRDWLPVEDVARVEVTSELADFPIENVFTQRAGPGWRSAQPGPQRVRIVFDSPVPVRHIQLRFEETRVARTQEFSLRWGTDSDSELREIVRQQWNFSPQGSAIETEDYSLDLLGGVSVLELNINPDIGNPQAVANLAHWLIA